MSDGNKTYTIRKRKIRAIDSYITPPGAATIEGAVAKFVVLDNFQIEHVSFHTHFLLDTHAKVTPFEQLCQNSLYQNENSTI